MATLEIIKPQQITHDHENIKEFLEKYNIKFGTFELTAYAKSLAEQKNASDEERTKLLGEYSYLKEKYAKCSGFREDVVFLHPGFPHYDALLTQFGDIHFHFENEYWYFFGGHFDFGFLGNDGRKFYLTVRAGEFLSVPEGIWQWLRGTNQNQMKAMRFFNTSNQYKQPEIIEF